MSEFQDPGYPSVTSTGTPRWIALAVGVLGAVSVLGLGVGAVALSHTSNIEQSTQTAVRQATDGLNQRLAKEEEINQQLQSDLKVVTDKLNVTQSELISARKQNRTASVNVDKKLNGLQSSMAKLGSMSLMAGSG
jgi:septal ring factor EnvC (AmiA/AmiB activator)